MNIVPIIDSHFDELVPQESQSSIGAFFQDKNYREQICFMPDGFTGIIDGKVIGMAGVARIYPHIGTAWAVLSQESGKHMVAITKAVKSFLDTYDCPRIEIAVLHDFKEGHRWAKMLGFTNETPSGMRNYGVDGKTYDLYARYK